MSVVNSLLNIFGAPTHWNFNSHRPIAFMVATFSWALNLDLCPMLILSHTALCANKKQG